jgi:glycosyltransferase involved in cell wall biosynthesis
MGDLIVISHDPFRRVGGSESYLIGHCRAALLAGTVPHMFSVGDRSEIVRTDFGVLHRVATPIRPIRSLTAPLQRPWLVRAMLRFLDGRPGPHLIQGYGAWGDSALHGRRKLTARGVDAVAVTTFFSPVEHETAAKLAGAVVRDSPRLRLQHALELAWARAITIPVERRTYHGCDAAVVNYESVRTLMAEAYGPRDGIYRLPYASHTAFEPEPDARSPRNEDLGLPSEAGVPLIVSVSRHDGRKGLDVLIHALAGLRDAGVPFRACLVGTGVLLEAHRRLVAALGLQALVSFPGRVPDVMPYLRACDVYVLPSTEEGSGSVAVLEALQAGAAIVSTSVDGMPEDLTDGQDAVLVAPGSAADLLDALTRLLGDDALRERLGTAARALYERRFSPGVVSRTLTGFHAEIGFV